VIFELEFLRYGKHDNRPVKISRMMEIRWRWRPMGKRSKRGVGGSLGLWLGSKEQKLFAILDHEGHEIETWRWGEDDA
jgi:hypothetical protein